MKGEIARLPEYLTLKRLRKLYRENYRHGASDESFLIWVEESMKDMQGQLPKPSAERSQAFDVIPGGGH